MAYGDNDHCKSGCVQTWKRKRAVRSMSLVSGRRNRPRGWQAVTGWQHKRRNPRSRNHGGFALLAPVRSGLPLGAAYSSSDALVSTWALSHSPQLAHLLGWSSLRAKLSHAIRVGSPFRFIRGISHGRMGREPRLAVTVSGFAAWAPTAGFPGRIRPIFLW